MSRGGKYTGTDTGIEHLHFSFTIPTWFQSDTRVPGKLTREQHFARPRAQTTSALRVLVNVILAARGANDLHSYRSIVHKRVLGYEYPYGNLSSVHPSQFILPGTVFTVYLSTPNDKAVEFIFLQYFGVALDSAFLAHSYSVSLTKE